MWLQIFSCPGYNDPDPTKKSHFATNNFLVIFVQIIQNKSSLSCIEFTFADCKKYLLAVQIKISL